MAWFDPTTEVLNAFNRLKAKSVEPPLLAFCQPHRPYKIDTDAFANTLRVVLLQKQSDSNLRRWATIGYGSRMLNQAEQKYEILYCPGLVQRVPDLFSRFLHILNTEDFEPINDSDPTYESRHCFRAGVEKRGC